MSDEAEGKTIYNALTMTSEEVEIVKEEIAKWRVTMDKSTVRSEEKPYCITSTRKRVWWFG